MFTLHKQTAWVHSGLFLLLPLLWSDCARAALAEGNVDQDGVIVPTFLVPAGSVSILNAGEGSVSISLTVPPGVRGIAPKVTLRHTTGNGDRGLGAGWSINVGYPDAIRRATRFGVPTYNDAQDVFTFDGQDLVPDGTGRYRTKIDSFQRIIFSGGVWFVTETDGTQLEYGAISSVSQGAYAWHLSRVRDPLGNTIEFLYEGPSNARRLLTIRYTLDASNNPIGQEQLVVFRWEINRPDARTAANYGELITRDARLRSIETKSLFSLLRTYELCYAGEDCSQIAAPLRGISLLTSIRELATDGTSIPARYFRYQKRKPGWKENKDGEIKTPFAFIIHNITITGQTTSDLRSKDNGLRMVDVNGDGFMDLVLSNPFTSKPQPHGHGIVFLHDGDSNWNLAPEWDVPVRSGVPIQFVTEHCVDPFSGIDLGVRILDVNGDGLADLLTSLREVWLNNGQGWNDPGEYALPSGFQFVNTNGCDQEDRGVRLADINGDGLPDLLRARENENSVVYLNNGSNGWYNAPEWQLPLDFLKLADNSGYTDAGVRLVDINADGLADLVRSFNVRINGFPKPQPREIWFNTGAGWEKSDTWEFPLPFFNDHAITTIGRVYFDYSVRVVDVDGDGYPDVLRSLTHKVGTNPCDGKDDAPGYEVWLNNQSNGFVLAEDWQIPIPLVFHRCTPGSTAHWSYVDNGVRIADVNGDGLADLVQGMVSTYWDANGWLADIPRATTHLALAGQTDLLTEHTNPLGGKATIKYKQATGLGLPAGQMPFTRTVATELTEDGGLDSVMSTRFEFLNGFYDPQNRDFRGFQHVVETYADGNRREREFYVDEGRKGRLHVETLRDNEGAYQERVLDYSAVFEGSFGFYNTLLDSEAVTTFQQDTESNSATRVSEFQYDQFGNRTMMTEAGYTGGVERSTTMTYAVNQSAWIVDRPAIIERYAGNGEQLLSREEFYYDGQGLQSVTQGLLTQKVLHDPRLSGLDLASGSTDAVTTFQHDAYGNVILEHNGRGFNTTIDYTGNGFLFPHTRTRVQPDASDIVRVTVYDQGQGVLTSDTDPNGHTTSYQYDGLGRLLSITLPDDPAGDPTVSVTNYQLGTIPAFMEIAERLNDTLTRTRREYFDGFGRPKGKVRGLGTYVMSDMIRYDNRGRRQRVYEPFFKFDIGFVNSGPSGTHSTALSYEDDKVHVIVHPGGARSSNFYLADGVIHTDENSEETTSRFDAFGQLIEVTNAVGTTSYSYDGLGGLSRITDARGLVTDTFHDARGLLRGLNHPDASETPRNGFKIWNDYDQQGNHSHRWAGADVWRAEYDALDRQTRFFVSRNGGVSFKIESSWLHDVGENAKGRLSRITGYGPPLTMNSLSYDVRGRISEEKFFFFDLDHTLDPNFTGVGIVYTYDRQDDVKEIRDPRGRLIKYIRDIFGRIGPISYNDMFPDRIADISYDAAGRVTNVLVGLEGSTALNAEYTYDPRGRMKTIGGDGPLRVNYRYDNVGNLLEETHANGRMAVTYDYDELHRLIGASGSIGNTGIGITYDYDQSGNLRSASGQGTSDVSYEYINGTNRLAGVHFTGLSSFPVGYDPHGNLTDIEDSVLHAFSRNYTYDALGRLSRYTSDNGSGTFVYDGRGRKVRRTLPDGSQEIYFHTVGGHVLATYQGGNWKTYLLADGQRLGFVDHEDKFRFIQSDRLGSARAIVGSKPSNRTCRDEETGKPIPCPPTVEVTWSGDYLPFGMQINAMGTGDNFRFTGQEYEPGIEIYDYGARYYDPLLRRFLQIDSFLGVPNDPRTLNRYSYALNSPTGFVDPTGNTACDPDDPFCFTAAAGDETKLQAERAERKRSRAAKREREEQEQNTGQSGQLQLRDADKQQEREKRYNMLMLAATMGNISQAKFEMDMAELLEVYSNEIPSVISGLKLPGVPGTGDRAKPHQGGALFTQDYLDRLQQFPTSNSPRPSSSQARHSTARQRAGLRARSLWATAQGRRRSRRR